MTTNILGAFLGDPALKIRTLDRVRSHRQAGRLIPGVYWDGSKGCAIGCTLESAEHDRYEVELGIPSSLAYLKDAIFEGLPHEAAQRWPEAFLEAIQPGADLSRVAWRILSRILGEVVFPNVASDEPWGVRAAIEGVRCVLDEAARSGEMDHAAALVAWSSAASAEANASRSGAAWSTAALAARSTAWSTAALAVGSAAGRNAMWHAAVLGVWSVARSAAAAAAAERAAWQTIASITLAELRGAVVEEVSGE